MAKRRCFSVDVMESDEYLSLPPQAKILYIALIAKSDDDGFAVNAKTAMRLTETTENEVEQLIKKGFLLEVDGTYVITHWHLHNRIPPTKKAPTRYKDKLEKLAVNSEGLYELME